MERARRELRTGSVRKKPPADGRGSRWYEQKWEKFEPTLERFLEAPRDDLGDGGTTGARYFVKGSV
jgi:hypothetical protein